MNEQSWKKTGSGIWVPPDTVDPHVERAEFKTKVKGFFPQSNKRSTTTMIQNETE
jgi:hypothetical protein